MTQPQSQKQDSDARDGKPKAYANDCIGACLIPWLQNGGSARRVIVDADLRPDGVPARTKFCNVLLAVKVAHANCNLCPLARHSSCSERNT